MQITFAWIEANTEKIALTRTAVGALRSIQNQPQRVESNSVRRMYAMLRAAILLDRINKGLW
jgi:hypothetical protein